MIRPLRTIVPFAESPRRVARRLERIRQRSLIRVQPLLSRRDAAHAGARMITPREKLRARRRAHRANVESIQRRSAARDGVDVWRAHLRVAADAVVAPARIIGEEDDDVRTRRREHHTGRGREHRDQNEGLQNQRQNFHDQQCGFTGPLTVSSPRPPGVPLGSRPPPAGPGPWNRRW
jgi:hypothetical protein